MISIIGTSDDRDKVIRLYEKYKQSLYYVAYKILHDHAAAEDAVHDTFVRIIDHLHKIDERNEHKTKGFLFVICKHVAINMYHAKMNLNQNADLYDKIDTASEPTNDALSIVINNENTRALIDAIKSMDLMYQNVLILKYCYHCSYEEMSKLLKTDPSTLRKRVERGRKKLSGLLEKERSR
ncbi:MAG: sigma-70 family RNA polymerase sigma factor [Clostridia bacterium]|nr:sigma-70 family RNA polymerase sigma factor [Clostridia bacterium]